MFAVHAVAPADDHEFAGQGRLTLAPGATYVPGALGLHALEPALESVPAAHGLHAVLPAGAYVPAGQGAEHWVSAVGLHATDT